MIFSDNLHKACKAYVNKALKKNTLHEVNKLTDNFLTYIVKMSQKEVVENELENNEAFRKLYETFDLTINGNEGR